MDIATIRSVFSQFSDTTKYPDTVITFWLNQGIANFNANVWGGRLDEGLLYYTAHNLALADRAARYGRGGSSGLLASKSVGPGSVSYDNSLGSHEGAGSYNLTPYGVRLWELIQMAGMGGVQLSPLPVANYGNQDGSLLYSGVQGYLGGPGSGSIG